MAQFILPGQVPDRETVEGWRRWRLSRHAFVPAPRIGLGEYRLMSPRQRGLHDLHRHATHSNLPLQETPMSAELTRIMRTRMQANALKHRPTTRAGLMITGGGYQGKTETACEIAAAFEDAWLELHNQLNPEALPGTRDLHVPVAYVQTPVTATPKSTCRAILDFYGDDHRKMTLPELTRQVRVVMHQLGTRVLILDDITRLRMHRADDQNTLDLLRALMSMKVTLVLIGVGIPRSGLLRGGRRDPRTDDWIFGSQGNEFGDEAATQTQRRFTLIHLKPFHYSTAEAIAAWTAHLAGLEENLRLLRAEPGMLTCGTMPEYLFRRTNGVVGLLERLIEGACSEAITDGTEKLTPALLDTVVLDIENDSGRSAEDGEIPLVPAPETRTRRKATKNRNTVFDDSGVPETKTGA
ncbi:TniB family NTP-binding protein (plasmid) [Nocardia sp. NBC_01377]